MSELKTNKISTNDGNNVAIDNALGLKSYDTTARDALTSVAGDMIYNTTESKPQFYNGSAWADFQDTPELLVEYIVVAGGGSGGGDAGGGGGAGGYLSSVSGESSGGGTSAVLGFWLNTSTSYTVTIGSGAAPNTARGSNSVFSGITTITATGGGRGGYYNANAASTGGSGGGGANQNGSGAAASPAGQGYAGGRADMDWTQGGGGGAGGTGVRGNAGGTGGIGVQTSITGTAMYLAGGGGGGGGNSESAGDGGLGGGGQGQNGSQSAVAGTANTGGGGGGGKALGSPVSQSGGSGVIYFKYPDNYTISGAGGATATETNRGDGYKYAKVTTSGTVSFS
jgi:hypothetical protein